MIELDIYEKNKYWWRNISFSTYSIIIVLFSLGLIYFTKINPQYFYIILALYFIALVVYRSLEFEPLNGKIIGKLILNENSITISNKEYKFSEIKYANFKANYYYRFDKDKAFLRNSGTKYHSGNQNYFRVILKNDKEIKGEFIIGNEIQLNKVKLYSENLKKIINQKF